MFAGLAFRILARGILKVALQDIAVHQRLNYLYRTESASLTNTHVHERATALLIPLELRR